MPRFRVKAGKHSQKVDSGRKDDQGNPIRELKVFRTGEVVDTDVDLIARFGANKFELLGGGRPSGAPYEGTPSVAPGGQVSSGKQVAVGPQGSAAFAGPGSPDDVTSPKDLEKGPETGPQGQVRAAGEHKAQAAKGPTAPQPPQGAKAPPNFDSMSDADLRHHAEENEIDLKGAKNRADLLKAVKGHSAK